MSELKSALLRLDCLHLLLILDCCFAGMFPLPDTKDINNPPDKVPEVSLPLQRYVRFVTNTAWRVLTSCSYDERSVDGLGIWRDSQTDTFSPRKMNSPFASALIECLKPTGEATSAAPRGVAQILTVYDLQANLLDYNQLAGRQTPRLELFPGKRNKGEFVFLRVRDEELNLEPAPTPGEYDNPYQGLDTFTELQQRFFFGREVLTDNLYGAVQSQPFTVVLGSSGSGKSSLARAGLVPQFCNLSTSAGCPCAWKTLSERQRALDLPKMCCGDNVAIVRPGNTPLQALSALRLGNQANTGIGDSLAERVAGWLKTHAEPAKLLLVVDQLEELVTGSLAGDDVEFRTVKSTIKSAKGTDTTGTTGTTYTMGSHQYIAFLEQIRKALDDHSATGRFKVVATLRSDYEPHFITQDNPLLDYWRAIRNPAPARQTSAVRGSSISAGGEPTGAEGGTDRGVNNAEGEIPEATSRFIVRGMTQDVATARDHGSCWATRSRIPRRQ